MEWQLIPWSKKCIFKAVKEMYYTSLNCIKDDQEILQDGLNRLEKMLNVNNEHYHDLATFSSQEDILRAWGKPNFFGKKMVPTLIGLSHQKLSYPALLPPSKRN